MASRKAPICELCGNAMKKVIYGMPAPDEVRLDKYIYAGCVIELPMKQWDCLCYLEADSELGGQSTVGDTA